MVVVVACGPAPAQPTMSPDGGGAAEALDAVTIYEELEARIESGQGSEDDRKAALDRVVTVADDGTAAYAFSRAAILGRVAELRGVKAGKLVTQAEAWARKSVERDVEYRDRAASRMLGSLWVMAPARLLEHGDSEAGLELLEGLAQSYPTVAQNNLRVAEAYVFLGDPDPAVEFLCRARTQSDALRRDERELLQRLIDDVNDGEELSCDASSAE
jgi:hypothetical protein